MKAHFIAVRKDFATFGAWQKLAFISLTASLMVVFILAIFGLVMLILGNGNGENIPFI